MSAEGDPLKNAKKLMSAIEGIVQVLAPLASEERSRAIQGALVILRESPLLASSQDEGAEINVPAELGTLSVKAKTWMKQNGITPEHISEVFDFSDGVATVLAGGVPGKNSGEKTIKTYVLSGVAGLLSSGEPNFDDKTARKLCEDLGHYDNTNHAKYLKGKGSYFVGDKDKGWKLTAPGLKFGGSIVKELAGVANAD
jgi:hypothetical protein